MQHHADRLRMSESPFQHMKRMFKGVEGTSEAELRRQLGESKILSFMDTFSSSKRGKSNASRL